MPRSVRSVSRPSARVNFALPSPSMRTLPVASCALPQAAITIASFTETHQLVRRFDEARQVLCRARAGERAGHREDRDALAFGELGDAAVFRSGRAADAVFDRQLLQGDVGQAVAFLDGHVCLSVR